MGSKSTAPGINPKMSVTLKRAPSFHCCLLNWHGPCHYKSVLCFKMEHCDLGETEQVVGVSYRKQSAFQITTR